MSTAIEQAEQVQTTIAELEARASGLRKLLETPADLSGDFRKVALMRLQAREELAAVEQELTRQRSAYNAVHIAAEGERMRLQAEQSRLVMSRAFVTGLQTGGLRQKQIQSLTLGDVIRKLDRARGLLAAAGEDVPPIVVEL